MANRRRSRQPSRRRKKVRVRATLKRNAFLHQTFATKRVQSLPGIGPTYGKMLKVCGYMKANRVINRYLKLHGNKRAFVKWLRATTGASEYHANQCYAGIRRWVRDHLRR